MLSVILKTHSFVGFVLLHWKYCNHVLLVLFVYFFWSLSFAMFTF